MSGAVFYVLFSKTMEAPKQKTADGGGGGCALRFLPAMF